MRKVSLIIPIIITFLSCNHIDNCKLDSVETNNNNSYIVSLAEAIDIASSYINENCERMPTRTSGMGIKNCFSIHDTRGNSMLHVINYEGGGFTIVSGDVRLRPIQAFSPSGLFEENIEYPLGIRIWFESIASTLKESQDKGEEPDDETKFAWLKYREKGVNYEKLFTRSLDPEEMPTEEVDTLVGPFITDFWHQGTPYNDSLELSHHYYRPSFTYEGILYEGDAGSYQPVVGCTPLAIARVLRYHHKPYNYSWSSMPNNTPQTVATKSFIKDVHYAVKSYADSYSYLFQYYRVREWYNSFLIGFHNETGVSSSFPIGLFLRNQYGYPVAVTESYELSEYEKMRREMIDHSLPCIIGGNTSENDGHTWICDGYNYNFTPYFDYSGQQIGGVFSTYLHYCWGQVNNTYDGWFLCNNASMGSSNYSYNMSLTHHISEFDFWNPLFP